MVQNNINGISKLRNWLKKKRMQNNARKEKQLSLISKEKAVATRYLERTGKRLSLEDPQTFNEKIQWIKLYGPKDVMGRLADKYLVREFVAHRIGEKYLVPLLGVWDDPSDIDFDDLPRSYVLKATHGSAMNIIVKDKSAADNAAIRNQLSQWMGMDYSYGGGFEFHYGYCEPRVIAEVLLENSASVSLGNDDASEEISDLAEPGELYDYKFWCFDGKVAYIQFLENRRKGLKMAFFDPEWNRMPFVYDHPPVERDVPKPSNLERMIFLAEQLSEGFPHVRVDFYRLDNGEIYFGEMTFTSMAGYCRWTPPKTDSEMGKLFNLPKNSP